MSAILEALSRKVSCGAAQGLHHADAWSRQAPSLIVARRPSALWMACFGLVAGAALATGAVLASSRRLPPPEAAAAMTVAVADPRPAPEVVLPSPTETATPTVTPTSSPSPSHSPTCTRTPYTPPPSFVLSATLNGGNGRPTAIVDGKVVGVGAVVGNGYRIEQIGDGWVKCEGWPHPIRILGN